MQTNLLKGWLKANGINYKKGAEITGLSENNFCNKVNGKHDFRVEEVKSLVKAATVQNSPTEILQIFLGNIIDNTDK